MNKVKQVKALFRAGNRVECLDNTYIPSRRGERFRITQTGHSGSDAISERDGAPYRMIMPTRVRDVLSVSDSRASFLIDEEGNYCTWKVIGDR